MGALQDKVIWITGGLGELGRSAIAMFLARGAVLFVCDRIPIERYPEIERLKRQYGDQRLQFAQADVCDERAVQSVMSDIERCFGRLDGTYHNVYTNVWKPAVELSLPEWDETIRGTLTSTFLVCKYAIPLMIRSGGGSIVNTSSILGEIPSKGCLAYGAAKAGVIQFTRVLAVDYAQDGIRANALLPGNFLSDQRLAEEMAQPDAGIRRSTWLGRSGSADEINEMASFLLSDAASYVTGSAYKVDGGFH